MNGFNGNIYNEIFQPNQLFKAYAYMAFLDVCMYMKNVAKGQTGTLYSSFILKKGDQKDPSDQSIYDISRESPEKMMKAANIIFVCRSTERVELTPQYVCSAGKKMQEAITMAIYIYTKRETQYQPLYGLYTHSSPHNNIWLFFQNMLSQRHNNLQKIRMQACLNYHGCFRNIRLNRHTVSGYLQICRYVDMKLMYRIVFLTNLYPKQYFKC